QLGVAGAAAAWPRQGIAALAFGHAGAAAALVETQTVWRARISRVAFSVSICVAARISRRRARPHLLWISGGSDVSHQSKNLRAEIKKQRSLKENENVWHRRTRQLGQQGSTGTDDARAVAPRP